MVNKLIAYSTGLLFFCLSGCSNSMNNKTEKFDWSTTESAPNDYPMRIIRGTFIYRGEQSNGLYVPSGGTLSKGWGIGISSHVVGPDTKPLPDRLDISFISLAENQFYQGSFDLPYNEILSLFREGLRLTRTIRLTKS